MNTFRLAREAARHCMDKNKRDALLARTDDAKAAFDVFTVSCSQGDMENLVAAWSRMVLALDMVGHMPDGDPVGAGRLHLPTTGSFIHDPDIYDVIGKLTGTA